MKKNLIFILFISLFLFIPKVNAETFNVNPHVSIGGYTVPTYWGINANTTTNLVIKLEDWQGYSQTFNANFGYFEVCANFPVKFNNNNADCSDGCFASEFNTYNTGSSCKIYDTNYEGTKYYVFFSIKEYGLKNADTLPIVYDTFSFNNPYSYSVYFSLDNSYLSNEDLYLNFADQIRNEQLQQETNNKLDTQIGQNETIIDQNETAENTRQGMWGTLKSMLNFLNPLSKDFFAYKLVELMLNMLKSLFIPEDMDFVTNFVDALESKLGFIAAIPVKIIEFTMNLATATWSEFNSISFPSISIFGYNFWNAQEVDLTEAINIFKPFKYITDCICVILCARTLNKWREQFTGGGSGK